MGARELVFDIFAIDRASATFAKVGASAEGAAGKSEASGAKMGMAFLGAGVVVGALATKAVMMAADFQSATTQLVTGAGESTKNIKMVSDGLLAMAPAVGIGPTALAKAMFLVESAGYHGADGLRIMKAAAEGAKIGGAEATVVANALTTAMTDYHMPTQRAADVTSQLVATVATGKTNMADLAASLSAVLPSASAAHIGLSQVLGAMGTMTGEGISAQQASQNLAGTIASLANPTSVATKMMAGMGLNSIDVAKNLGKNGLTGTIDTLSQAVLHHMGPAGLVLQDSFNQSKIAAASATQMLSKLPPSLQGLGRQFLANTITQKEWAHALKGQDVLTANLGKQFAFTAKHAHGFTDSLKAGGGSALTYNAAMAEMTGGVTGLNTSLALSGAHTATFNANVKAISGATADAAGHVKGWAEVQKDLSTRIDQVKAGVEAFAVKIGTALIPFVIKGIDVVARIGAGIGKLGEFLADNAGKIAIFAGVITTVMLPSLVSMGVTAASSGAVMAAVWLSEAADAAVGAAASVAGSWAVVGGWVASAAAATAGAVAVAAAWLISIWPIALVIAAVVGLAVIIVKNWDTIKHWTISAWHAISAAVSTAWNNIKGWVSTALGAIVGFVTTWGAKILNAVTLPYRLAAAVLIGLGVLLFNAVKGPVTRILAEVTARFRAVQSVISTVINAVVSFLASRWENLKANASAAFNALRTLIAAAWGAISSVISSAVGAVGSMVSRGFNALVGFVSGPVNTVRSVVGSAFNSLVGVISGAIGSISNAAGQVGSGIIGGIRSAISGIGSIGSDIINGIIGGMSGMAGQLYSFVMGFIKSNVPGPVLKLLGIASPSKLFAQIGANTGQGLIEGIAGKQPAVQAAMRSLVTPPKTGTFDFASSARRAAAVSGSTAPSATGSAGAGAGSMLHIEHYHEAQRPPDLIAADLAFRLRNA